MPEFVLIEGEPKTKTVNVYGPFADKQLAKDFAYETMMVPKYTKVVPLLTPELEEQPEFHAD